MFNSRGRFLGAMGNLEVVVKCVFSPREIRLNDIMTYTDISGSNITPMSFKFILSGGSHNGDNP